MIQYQPYEPVGENLFNELKINNSGITITCEGLRSAGKAFNEAIRHCWDDIDAMRYCVEDIKNTKKLEEKEGKDMKLLNMYVEKSEGNIRKYYKNLIELEKNNDVVQKEYDKVVEGYKKAMEELAEKYNEVNSPTGSFIIIEPAFGMESRFTVVHKTTEKEEMYTNLCNEELKQLHDKIDEVNAQLEIIGNDEHSSHRDVNYVLHNYGIIDENNKLTPYTPVENKKAKK